MNSRFCSVNKKHVFFSQHIKTLQGFHGNHIPKQRLYRAKLPLGWICILCCGYGFWNLDRNSRGTYNKWDGVARCTTQVFPGAWTAILVSLDNVGMWNLRAQNLNVWYLGQEVYVSVVNPEISNKTELPLPDNAIYCGLLTYLQKTQAHKVSFSGAETVCKAQVESQVEVVCG